MKIAFVSSAIESLGIEYVSAVLKQAGHQVKLFIDPQLFDDVTFSFKKLNQMFSFKEDVIADLKAYRPDLVGFSVITTDYPWAGAMAQRIKAELNVPIIMGGIHPTVIPERVITNPWVDMICVGEGEYPMLELVRSMERGSPDYAIQNIWFKKDGAIIRNPLRPPIRALDKLPFPDKTLFYDQSPHFKTHYVTAAGRGCPFTCSYCLNSYIHATFDKGPGPWVRMRSVDSVIRELSAARRIYDSRTVFFLDECFGLNNAWLKEFSAEYKQKINRAYVCTVHPQTVTPEKIEYLKTSGCRAVYMGIQSWDTAIRNQWFNRRISNETMERAIRLILKAKIELLVENIINISGQEPDDIVRINMPYTRLRPNRILFYTLKYYPNYQITRKAQKEGRLDPALVDAIEQGSDYERFAITSLLAGKNRENRELVKAQKLLFVMDIVPGRILRYIIRKRLYRFFPVIFSPALLLIARALLSPDEESRCARNVIFGRYYFFLKKKIFTRRKNIR